MGWREDEIKQLELKNDALVHEKDLLETRIADGHTDTTLQHAHELKLKRIEVLGKQNTIRVIAVSVATTIIWWVTCAYS